MFLLKENLYLKINLFGIPSELVTLYDTSCVYVWRGDRRSRPPDKDLASKKLVRWRLYLSYHEQLATIKHLKCNNKLKLHLGSVARRLGSWNSEETGGTGHLAVGRGCRGNNHRKAIKVRVNKGNKSDMGNIDRFIIL